MSIDIVIVSFILLSLWAVITEHLVKLSDFLNIFWESMLFHVFSKVWRLIMSLRFLKASNTFLLSCVLRENIILPALIDHAFDEIRGELSRRLLLLRFLVLLMLYIDISYCGWLIFERLMLRRWWRMSYFIWANNFYSWWFTSIRFLQSWFSLSSLLGQCLISKGIILVGCWNFRPIEVIWRSVWLHLTKIWNSFFIIWINICLIIWKLRSLKFLLRIVLFLSKVSIYKSIHTTISDDIRIGVLVYKCDWCWT